MPRQLTVDQIEQRIAAIAATERQRPLTDAERDELDNLFERRRKRACRIHDQIADAEARVERLRTLAQRLAA